MESTSEATFPYADYTLWVAIPEPPPHDSSRFWEGVTFTWAQVGGYLMHYRPLLGFPFGLPDSDPLVELCRLYEGSGYTGLGDTPVAEIELLAERLKPLGLCLDRDRAGYFSEAYIPIEAASAWSYALARGLRLPLFRRTETTELVVPEQLGITSWADACEYLRLNWGRIKRIEPPESAPLPDLVGAVVFPNSD